MLAGFLVRVINIDEPFVDSWSYRQSDIAMVARNFYQHGYDILSPRIDYGGAQPGYVGMEFPVVPFIGAALYQPFGEREAIGRAVSLIFFMLSVPPLFLLVEMIANKRTALLAICLYTLMPLTIFCGRSFISDMAANSFSIWAVWLFARWLQDRSRWRWFAAALTTAAAVLTKAPYVIVGFPMAYLAVKRFGVGAFIRRELWLYSFLALVPSVLWYSYARCRPGCGWN
jgi:4-amino-4-deoxy-L-arabinose transferase-like glycosyltransferase